MPDWTHRFARSLRARGAPSRRPASVFVDSVCKRARAALEHRLQDFVVACPAGAPPPVLELAQDIVRNILRRFPRVRRTVLPGGASGCKLAREGQNGGLYGNSNAVFAELPDPPSSGPSTPPPHDRRHRRPPPALLPTPPRLLPRQPPETRCLTCQQRIPLQQLPSSAWPRRARRLGSTASAASLAIRAICAGVSHTDHIHLAVAAAVC